MKTQKEHFLKTQQLHENPFHKILWDDQSRVIGIDWKEGTSSMTDEDFKKELTLFADYVEAKKAAGILVDVAQFRHKPGPDIEQWRVKNISGRYYAAGVRRFAFLFPEGVPIPPMMSSPGDKFATRAFNSAEEAMAWLKGADGDPATIHMRKQNTMNKTNENTPSNVVWFNIPADDIKRTQKFYSSLFGWEISPFNGMNDTLHIDTGGPDASPDGGITKRQSKDQAIVNYIGVDSVDKYLKKVQELGGKVCMPKTAVPQMGYLAVCQDSENNGFGLWEQDSKAK